MREGEAGVEASRFPTASANESQSVADAMRYFASRDIRPYGDLLIKWANRLDASAAIQAELLTALKDVLAVASANAEDLEGGEHCTACDAARAALAKATGR